ncbi:hypothetical protein BDI4_910052 [Burkholderia diffusa]|uniref:helix-turn-helix transcriptional regulator n=1 Tax=Burkholderia diffusa TaxID=488732 RepID=UPI001CAC0389|nr:AlpA family transcriptional regulator [Burkholderia diffusa]CAG9265693.1 hypothetical protein BDI4_910052 [Burkholderia diffusa]
MSGGAPLSGWADDLQVIGLEQLRLLLNVSARTVRRLERTDPDFPKGFRLGGRAHNWLVGDVRAYLMKKAGKCPAE